MDRPSIHTDAYEDSVSRNVPLIFLAGPIKYWWSCWDSPEHLEYIDHRVYVRSWLIEKGYLTYAPWDAIKGTWSMKAQVVNNAAICQSDLMVWMTPDGVPADGTLQELEFARKMSIPMLWVPPGKSPWRVQEIVGPGHKY